MFMKRATKQNCRNCGAKDKIKGKQRVREGLERLEGTTSVYPFWEAMKRVDESKKERINVEETQMFERLRAHFLNSGITAT